MRRLVRIPAKTLAVAAIISAGAIYVAAEARQTVIMRRQLELEAMESRNFHRQRQAPLLTPSAHSNEVATQEAARTRAAKPAKAVEIHHRQIVISIPDRRLALLEDGRVVKAYPIAVGARRSPSPNGDFQIINHAANPVYRHKGKAIAPGNDNPLGTRWMGLSLKGYGIHGTNMPGSVGKAVSHGCFRMRQRDVEDLYRRVRVGDEVIVRRERDGLIAQVFPAPAIPPATVETGNTQATSVLATEVAAGQQ